MKSNSAAAPSGAEILLVDDNHYGLDGRRQLLQEIGHRVSTAGNAGDALELLATREFDLVVTDYKMPDMNGTQLIGEIRMRRPKMRIILLSGFVDVLGLDEKNTGADIVIQKSAGEVPNLVRSVTRLLNRRPSRKAPGSANGAPDTRKSRSARP